MVNVMDPPKTSEFIKALPSSPVGNNFFQVVGQDFTTHIDTEINKQQKVHLLN